VPAPAAHHLPPPAPRPAAPPFVITTHQRRRATQRTRQVKRLKNLHCFLQTLHRGLLRSRVDNNAPPSTGTSGQNRQEIRWPPMGRSGNRRRGIPVVAYGTTGLRGDSHGRRHPSIPRQPRRRLRWSTPGHGEESGGC
jgi:hypothetical protein